METPDADGSNVYCGDFFEEHYVQALKTFQHLQSVPSAGEVRTAIDEISVPRGQPSPEELEQMAQALAEITYYADPEALAAFAEAA